MTSEKDFAFPQLLTFVNFFLFLNIISSFPPHFVFLSIGTYRHFRAKSEWDDTERNNLCVSILVYSPTHPENYTDSSGIGKRVKERESVY